MSLLVEWLELCRKLGWSGQGGRGRAPAPGIVHFSAVIATRMMIAKESAMLIKVCYSFFGGRLHPTGVRVLFHSRN